MIRGTVGALARTLGLALAGVLIAVPLLMWRLSLGPISLDGLTPWVEEALNAPGQSLHIHLDRTVLAAGSAGRLLELNALDVRVSSADGTEPIARVPVVALSLSGRALLGGVLAPHSIRLVGPRLLLTRDGTGQIHWGVDDAPPGPEPVDPAAAPPPDAAALVAMIKDALLGDPDPDRPGRALQMFSVDDAEVIIDDRALGGRVSIRKAGLSVRRIADGVVASASIPLDQDGSSGEVRLEGAYHKSDGSAEATARLSGIRPSFLARFGSDFAPLAGIDLAISGTIRAGILPSGALDGVGFDLETGPGTVTLTGAVPISRRLAHAALHGGISRGMSRIDVTDLTLDLGGPVLHAHGALDGLGAELTAEGQAALVNLPVDQLHDLWPAGLGDSARDWVVGNLSRGVVREATIALAGHSASGRLGDLVIDRVGGEIHPEGVSVDYLHPMPPARMVSADCTYDAASFRIMLKGGELYGLRLKEGSVVFSGLDKPDQIAEIEVVVAGSLTDALKVIDSPPLRYAHALGIEPVKVGGEALTRLRFKFPLLKALKIEDVEVNAHASAHGLSLPKVALGQDLENGQLDVDIDAKGLDAVGNVLLGRIPAHLRWRENFTSKGVAFRSRYQVQVAALSEDQRRQLGLDGVPFVAPYLAGPIGGDLTATFFDGGRGEIGAALDLAAARMELPDFGWSKEAGKPATAELTVLLDHRQISGVPRFTVKAGDLETRGAVAFGPDGKARRVDLAPIAFGRTRGDAALTLRPEGGIDVTFRGPSFDASPLLDKDDRPPEAEKPPPMAVTASIGTLWVSKDGALTNATAQMRRDGADWQAIALKAGLSAGKSVSLTLAPNSDHHRSLSLISDDAGALMRAFGLFDDLAGGDLTIDARYDDTKPNQPLSGVIKVSEYHLRNAPAFARLLTVAALTGILDLLQGEGVGFSSLEAPFTLSDGLVSLSDTRAWGPALGITARGQIDLDHSQLAIEGTVVPAYAINSVLGRIPVLGWLVTGGEAGGGVIAFNYTMKGSTDDPSVTVNPLSALTPGFLRKLFNIFDDGSGTRARSEPPAGK